MGRFELYPFAAGEIVTLRKPHPCGGYRWEILRTGADIHLRCLQCGHQQRMARRSLEKAVKRISEDRD